MITNSVVFILPMLSDYIRQIEFQHNIEVSLLIYCNFTAGGWCSTYILGRDTFLGKTHKRHAQKYKQKEMFHF